MSSTETSSAPAEGAATTPAPDSPAAPATFGSTRGSGLARGKRQSSGPASSTTAPAPGGYKPTAIEIVTAPREYQNPFAPVNPEPVERAEPAPVAEPAAAPAAEPAPTPVARTEPAREMFPLDEAPATSEADEKAELNILPPERPKTVAPQTWESEGFESGDAEPEARAERPVREPAPAEPVDPASIPEKFLWVRPGVEFVPTDLSRTARGDRAPRGDRETLAPRDHPSPHAARPAAGAPAKSGGFFGWIKSLFGGAEAPSPTAASGESRGEGRGGHHRRPRGGPGESSGSGEPRGEGRGGDRGGRRRRGGRGRGRSRGESQGSRQGGGY